MLFHKNFSKVVFFMKYCYFIFHKQFIPSAHCLSLMIEDFFLADLQEKLFFVLAWSPAVRSVAWATSQIAVPPHHLTWWLILKIFPVNDCYLSFTDRTLWHHFLKNCSSNMEVHFFYLNFQKALPPPPLTVAQTRTVWVRAFGFENLDELKKVFLARRWINKSCSILSWNIKADAQYT